MKTKYKPKHDPSGFVHLETEILLFLFSGWIRAKRRLDFQRELWKQNLPKPS